MVEESPLLDRVKTFVAGRVKSLPGAITPATNLFWDLDLVGEDAVRFFVDFVEAFGIAPDSLNRLDFMKHFGDEGLPAWASYATICAVGLLVTVLGGAFGFPFWGVGTIMALAQVAGLAALCWAYRDRWDRPASHLITVGDLVEAAEAGKWVSKK
jgi:hypothetical protein